MNLRPTISAPLPWLTILAAKLFGKKNGKGKSQVKRPPFFVFPRTLEFTKEGKRFIAVLFLVGIAAINTGNNLLYLILAMLLSLIIISGVMSESTLRGLKAKRELPRHIYRGTPAKTRIVVENTKRLMPSYSFIVGEMRSPDAVIAETAYFLKLDGGRKAVKTVSYSFGKRGVVRLAGVYFKTAFPFGLFVKGRREPALEEMVVYPRVRPLRPEETKVPEAPSAGTNAARGKGAGTEIYGLRDYTFLDDARLIHWKASARTRRLVRKESERERERTVLVVFDNSGGGEAFEDEVEKAASIASHFIGTGFRVGLKTLSFEIAPGAGPGHLTRILKSLALVESARNEGRHSVHDGPPGVRVVYV
ncbi:MAG: DUF58 domain-containing protein [Deltaproteobacteria bacterium]|nr:DUF58 domain-containing protein [Deltaproteobacteria bacterium]